MGNERERKRDGRLILVQIQCSQLEILDDARFTLKAAKTHTKLTKMHGITMYVCVNRIWATFFVSSLLLDLATLVGGASSGGGA